MPYSLQEDANAVIFPAFASTSLSDECKRFLDRGGISILVGESRDEYVARQMSLERRSTETPETFTSLVREAKELSDNLLVAVDQELGGICRMHGLVPQFPTNQELIDMSAEEVEAITYRVATASKALGVNVFLAPIVDLVTGANPWLDRRTYSTDPEIVGRISAAYVRGVQKAGVAATAKHFPGFHNITGDPAIDAHALVVDDADSYAPGFNPFTDVIAAEVEMIMVGPAINKAFDPARAALRSKPVIDILKLDLRYQGIVMADNLDSKATMHGDSIEKVAVDAIRAGCDLLLTPDVGTQLGEVSKTLINAVETGNISREALAQSANKIRRLAQKYTAKL